MFWHPLIKGYVVVKEKTQIKLDRPFGIGERYRQYKRRSVSVTINSASNIPTGALDLMHDKLQEVVLKHESSLEVGKQCQHLHIQSIQETHFLPTATEADYRNFLKDIIDPMHTLSLQVCVRFIKPRDTDFLLGYAQKDNGRGSYDRRGFGYSELELANGRNSFNTHRDNTETN